MFDLDLDFDLEGLVLAVTLSIAVVTLAIFVIPVVGFLLVPLEFALAVAAGVGLAGLRLLRLRPWLLVVDGPGGQRIEKVFGLGAARARRAEILGVTGSTI